jgi:hypothetical protein
MLKLLNVICWCLQYEDYYLPNSLYAVNLPYVPRSICQVAYASRAHLIDETMICAGVGGRDSCQVSVPDPGRGHSDGHKRAVNAV